MSRVRLSARLMSVTLIALVMPMVTPGVAKADDACPDALVSSTQQADQLTPVSDYFANNTNGPVTQSFTVSSSWSNDTSLSGNFTLVHDAISVQFGVSISHTYSVSSTSTFQIPKHRRGRVRSRYDVWTNVINVRNWNGRTCSPAVQKTKTAKSFVQFEPQITVCDPPC